MLQCNLFSIVITEELEPIEEHIVQSSKAAIEEIPVPEESAADDQPEETGKCMLNSVQVMARRANPACKTNQ